jgi:hypothetical protein
MNILNWGSFRNPPVNVLQKYLFFPIYYVAFIDVLIDIEKYWEIIIRGRICITYIALIDVCCKILKFFLDDYQYWTIIHVLNAKFYKNIIEHRRQSGQKGLSPNFPKLNWVYYTLLTIILSSFWVHSHVWI